MANFSAANSIYATAASRLWDELQNDSTWTTDMVTARKKQIIAVYKAKAKKADAGTSRLVAETIDSPGSDSFVPSHDEGNAGEEEIQEEDEEESELSTEDLA